METLKSRGKERTKEVHDEILNSEQNKIIWETKQEAK